MDAISIPAHFDGERILLDEPFELEPHTRLVITVLPKHDAEREAWLRLSGRNLESAYAPDEGEYSLEMIKQANPEYERR